MGDLVCLLVIISIYSETCDLRIWFRQLCRTMSREVWLGESCWRRHIQRQLTFASRHHALRCSLRLSQLRLQDSAFLSRHFQDSLISLDGNTCDWRSQSQPLIVQTLVGDRISCAGGARGFSLICAIYGNSRSRILNLFEVVISSLWSSMNFYLNLNHNDRFSTLHIYVGPA